MHKKFDLTLIRIKILYILEKIWISYISISIIKVICLGKVFKYIFFFIIIIIGTI